MVVTHSVAPAVLASCLQALVSEADVVVVVANGSHVPERDDVEVIPTANEGFGAAANVGCRRCLERGASAILVVNDDAVAAPGWRSALERELSTPDVGAVQPVLVATDDQGPTIASLGVRIDRHGAGVDIGDGMADSPDARGEARDIELFTAGAVLLTERFLRATGGFDPGWFLYYEDVDLARRGASLGFRYRLAVDATVLHVRGTSTSARSDRTRYLQERNRLWVSFRHADPATTCRAVWLSVRRLRYTPIRVHVAALGAGFAGAPRQLWRRSRHQASAGRSETVGQRRPRSRR